MKDKRFIVVYENPFGVVESIIIAAPNKGVAYHLACDMANTRYWASMRVYTY